MKRNLNSLNEQILRMKSLFTEERMFGNLVEQEENEVETKELEGITVTGDKPETEQNTDTSKETEQNTDKSEEKVNLDKRACIKHIKEKHKEVESSGDSRKWKSEHPKDVESIESCLKTHYKTFQKEGIFKAGDEADDLIYWLELKIEKPKEVADKDTIQIKNDKGRVVMFIKNVKGNLYRFRGKKGEVIFDSSKSGGIGKNKYFNPRIRDYIMDQMRLDGKKITIKKGINTKGIDMGSFTLN